MEDLLAESKFMNRISESIGGFISDNDPLNHVGINVKSKITNKYVYFYGDNIVGIYFPERNPQSVCGRGRKGLHLYCTNDLSIIYNFINLYEIEPYTYKFYIAQPQRNDDQHIDRHDFSWEKYKSLSASEKLEFDSIIKPYTTKKAKFGNSLVSAYREYVCRMYRDEINADNFKRLNNHKYEFVELYAHQSSYIYNGKIEKLLSYVSAVIVHYDEESTMYTKDGTFSSHGAEYELAKFLRANEARFRHTKSSNGVCRK